MLLFQVSNIFYLLHLHSCMISYFKYDYRVQKHYSQIRWDDAIYTVVRIVSFLMCPSFPFGAAGNGFGKESML